MADQRPDLRMERRQDALWLWIDREERRNALNPAVLAGVETAMGLANADPSIRALVLTGVGEKAFCAGADLTQGASAFNAAPDEPTTDFGRLARKARMLGVPIIGRVNGACVAGGFALLGLCDIVIAADHARFGLPEVRVGVFPMQVLVFLRATMHARHIHELCLTGELISAARAAEMGVVNQVTPASALDSSVEAMLAKLRLASPAAVRRGKQAILAMEHMGFDEAMPFAEAQIALASRTADAAEGFAAFNEKRKPRWALED
jgi:enoyl-CoA hydratase/carnithine racemase